jgi:hypothetical protein
MPGDFSRTLDLNGMRRLQQRQAADVADYAVPLSVIAMPETRTDGQQSGRKDGTQPEYTEPTVHGFG